VLIEGEARSSPGYWMLRGPAAETAGN